MALQLGMLKFFILVGVGLVIVSTYNYMNQLVGGAYGMIFLRIANSDFGVLTHSKPYFIIMAIVLVVFMAIIGIVGVVGTLKQNTTMLVIYCIFVYLLFIGFWVIFGIFSEKKCTCVYL